MGQPAVAEAETEMGAYQMPMEEASAMAEVSEGQMCCCHQATPVLAVEADPPTTAAPRMQVQSGVQAGPSKRSRTDI